MSNFTLVMSYKDGSKQGNLYNKVKEVFSPERIAMLKQPGFLQIKVNKLAPESAR